MSAAHPRMDFADYERRLALSQGTLQLIQQAYLGTSERALVVLEGWDTAGKGGVVRRLGWALDPRSFKVHPIAAPNQHERAQHYFERFWCRLPENGQIVLFDRSWYGRVLVERVEGFCSRRQSARSASPRGYQAFSISSVFASLRPQARSRSTLHDGLKLTRTSVASRERRSPVASTREAES